jgi:serine/threonine protein kinase
MLQDGTHYNGRLIEKVFVKLFVNPFQLALDQNTVEYKNYVKRLLPSITDKNLTAKINKKTMYLEALYYEMVLQNSVITPIVTQGVCPFFPVAYSAGYNCLYTDVQALTSTLQPQIIMNTLLQDVDHPQMTARLKDAPILTPILSKLTYCMLVSEYINGVSLHDWMLQKNICRSGTTTTTHMPDFWVIMFQVAIACHVMELANVSHNDLHSKNVLIVEHPTPVKYCFHFPGNKVLKESYYRFSSRYEAKVFDFDRSNFSQYVNPLLQSNTNPFSTVVTYSRAPWKSKDFFKLVVNIANRVYRGKYDVGFINEGLLYIVSSPESHNEIINMYKASPQLQRVFYKKRSSTFVAQSVEKPFFDKLFSMSRIINELSIQANIQVSTQAPGVQEFVYVVDPRFFVNSRVITHQVYETLNHMNLELAEQIYNEAHVKEETKAVTEQLSSETVHTHFIKLELAQQQYDLSQMSTSNSNKVLFTVTKRLQDLL